MHTIMFAEQEMRRTRQSAISSGHLLLGLVAHGDNPAASIVSNGNISLDALRSKTCKYGASRDRQIYSTAKVPH